MFITKYWKCLIPTIIIICGIFVRLNIFLEVPDFGPDACMLATNLKRSYFDLFKPLDNVQVASPIFLIISKFLQDIIPTSGGLKEKDIILLILPFISGVLSLPLVYILANRMFNYYLACICLFLYAFNPISIYYSVTFKQYTFEALIALILLLIFYNLILEKTSTKKLFLISGIIAISPWCSISSLFIITSYFILLLIDLTKNNFKEKKKLIILFLPFMISLLIFYFGFFVPINKQMYKDMNVFWNEIDPSFFTVQNFKELLITRLSSLTCYSIFEFNIILFIIINTIIMISQKKLKELFYIIIPILLVVLACILKYYPFTERLLLFLLPLFYMLFLQFLVPLKERAGTTILIYILLFSGIYMQINEIKYRPLYQNFTTRKILDILISNNPNLENVIADEIIYPYYIEKAPLYNDAMEYNTLEYTTIHKVIPQLPAGEYWIYITTQNPAYSEYVNEILEKNSFKIEKKYDENNEYEKIKTILLHIKKI